MKSISTLGLLMAGTLLAGSAHATTMFVPGDLVVSVEGKGLTSGTYTDNQAAPLSLFQYTTSGSFVSSLVLPQSANGANFAVSGEYGSSSEGALQLSSNGKLLTIMGYGVNAAAFNANPTAYGTTTNDPTKPTALGQSGSLQGQGYIAVPRVVATIGANGSVSSTTGVYGVFNGNNPRSVATVDGSSFYISGQGNSPDNTGGVFYVTRGSHSATAITGLDTTSNTSSQDTRFVTIYNNQLYVSVDSKEGKNAARSFVGTLGASGALPTSLANGGNGPTMLTGFGNSGGTGKESMTAATGNGLNTGDQINLSPEAYFFANATTLYVADSGAPKNDSANSALGDGGLQKWIDVKGTWTLEYTISAGLNLVANSTANPADVTGTTGLLGLTGKVLSDGEVELFATNFTIGDTDPTYLFGVDDQLGATKLQAGEALQILASAPADSNFKGVSFAPVPEPETWALMLVGVGLIGAAGRAERRRMGAATA